MRSNNKPAPKRSLYRYMLVASLVAFAAVMFTSRSYAYVSVAPMTIYLTDADRSDRIIVKNNSNRHIEVVIDFKFGYPV